MHKALRIALAAVLGLCNMPTEIVGMNKDFYGGYRLKKGPASLSYIHYANENFITFSSWTRGKWGRFRLNNFNQNDAIISFDIEALTAKNEATPIAQGIKYNSKPDLIANTKPKYITLPENVTADDIDKILGFAPGTNTIDNAILPALQQWSTPKALFSNIEPNCYSIMQKQKDFAAPQDHGAQYLWYEPHGPVNSADYPQLWSATYSIHFNNRLSNYTFTLGNFERQGDTITFDITEATSPQRAASAQLIKGIQYDTKARTITLPAHAGSDALDESLGFVENTNILDTVILLTLQRLTAE